MRDLQGVGLRGAKTRGTCKGSVYRSFFHTHGCIYGVVGLRGIFQKCVLAIVFNNI